MTAFEFRNKNRTPRENKNNRVFPVPAGGRGLRSRAADLPALARQQKNRTRMKIKKQVITVLAGGRGLRSRAADLPGLARFGIHRTLADVFSAPDVVHAALCKVRSCVCVFCPFLF